MDRWRLVLLALIALTIVGSARLVNAERAVRPSVTSIAVDPENAVALEGILITFRSEESGATVSCTTDTRGGCTIDRGFPRGHLIVYASSHGAPGPARRIALPRSGEVLVYVPLPPNE